MEPLISVIVPVYNIEKYVRNCIESILAQSYKNLEVILVDDGSTDNSGKICDEYTDRDSRIRVIIKKMQVCQKQEILELMWLQAGILLLWMGMILFTASI